MARHLFARLFLSLGVLLLVGASKAESSSESVEFKNAGVIISGILDMPDSESSVPAAILVPGDGPTARDDPSLVQLSQYLTSIGFAVLRSDKRGVGRSSGSLSGATTADLSGDVTAAFAFLRKHKRIAPKQIGIIGHSEGALIASMVASRIPDTAFIVLMAHPTAGIEENLHLQRKIRLISHGASDDLVESERLFWTRVFALVRRRKPNTEIERTAAALVSGRSTELSTEYEKLGLNSLQILKESLPELITPWLEWLLGYDPTKPLTEVHCPILAIFCEKDWQVPPSGNMDAMEGVLNRRGKADYDVKLMDGLNHHLQRAETGSPEEYASLDAKISQDALRAIGDWLVSLR